MLPIAAILGAGCLLSNPPIHVPPAMPIGGVDQLLLNCRRQAGSGQHRPKSRVESRRI